MEDKGKTRDQLVDELVAMRQKVAELEASVAEHSQMEQSLRENEDRLRFSMDAVENNAIIVLNADGQIVSWNMVAEHIYGYHTQEIIGQHFSCLYASEDISAGQPEIELKTAVIEGRLKREAWHMRKDGSQIWTNGAISPIRDRSGNLRGFTISMREMTERKQAKEEKKKSEDDPQAKVDRMSADAIYINELRKRGTSIQIFLTNGVCLTGKIEAFSPYAIILRSQDRQQLIQKASVISIRPQKTGLFDVFRTKNTPPKKSG